MIFFTKRQTEIASALERGFGLIELLVSISIMVLVTTIVLAGHSSFNGTVLVRSQAYEIALRIREAQLTAVGAAGGGATNNFRALSGARFSSLSGQGNTYTVFTTATVGNGWQTGVTPAGAVGVLDQRFVITDITAVSNVGSTTLDTTYVVFNRPNFDARFFDSSGNELSSGYYKLVLSVGAKGATGAGRLVANERKVIITKAGQISVE